MRIGFGRVLLVCAALAPPADAQTFAWPDGHRAAVSLAYDDALDSQLDVAVPALDRHGFKASFYLVLSNPGVAARLPQWRAAAAHGHELGNHTLFHQCSGSAPERGWVAPHRDLDRTTAAQMQDQVRVANTLLTAIDGRQRRTFAPPCGEFLASGEDYVSALRGEFVGIRVPGAAVTPTLAALEPDAVASAAPAGASGADLIELVEEAGRRGTLVSLTFHGVGGDYLAVSAQAHEELLAYLDRHRDLYWVDTFEHIATYLRQHPRPRPAAARER